MGIVTVLDAIIAKLVADEIKTWLPSLSNRIVDFAVRRLPVEQRARYTEQWRADLLDLAGDLARFLYSVDLLRASWCIAVVRWVRADTPPPSYSLRSEIVDVRMLVNEIMEANDKQIAWTERVLRMGHLRRIITLYRELPAQKAITAEMLQKTRLAYGKVQDMNGLVVLPVRSGKAKKPKSPQRVP